MDVFQPNAPGAHSPGSSSVIGINCMINQEKFADRSDNSGAAARREKQCREEK
jgi:hypothetical protein